LERRETSEKIWFSASLLVWRDRYTRWTVKMERGMDYLRGRVENKIKAIYKTEAKNIFLNLRVWLVIACLPNNVSLGNVW
jgi:hypothetical protein